MTLGPNSSLPTAATLSPDGRWIARMELTASELGVTVAPNALTPIADELVIRASVNGKEVFRALAAGQFVGWIPSSSAFISQNGNDISVFSPSVRKPGAPPPVEPWTATPLSFSEDTGGVSSSMGANGSTVLELQTGAIAFSPDFRFAVKGSWAKGEVWWEVADLTTGKIAPPVKAGRWLDYNPRIGGFSSDIEFCVAPASLASGAKPVVALVQASVVRPRVIPTPTPIPTLAPTPTPSPAQTQFLKKAAREEAEIQTLVESVLGVDGEEPTVSDESEIARIEVEVKRRNRVLATERKRLFPQKNLVTAPPTQSPVRTQGKPFQIECFDLNAGKRLWISSLKTEIFEPETAFSPDGSALVAWGTSVTKNGQGYVRGDNSGFEIRAAKTGQLRARHHLLNEDFGIPNAGNIAFYSDLGTMGTATALSILVVKDSSTVPAQSPDKKNNWPQRATVLRFFDAAKAREIGHSVVDSKWESNAFISRIDNVTCNQTGDLWLFGGGDYALATRGELGQEFLKPMPTPTPIPAFNASPSAPR